MSVPLRWKRTLECFRFFCEGLLNPDLRQFLDTRYFWHNLALVEPSIDVFHFPFLPEYGDAPTFFRQRVENYLGARVLELGAGSGWLKSRWEIQEYVGVEQNDFTRPYQKQLREKAQDNGVLLGTRVSDVIRKLRHAAPFDSIVCYESFHAFPNDAVRVALSSLLRDKGTLILVDGAGWWPKTLDFSALRLKKVFAEEIPTDHFDNKKVYDVTFRALDVLDKVVHSRSALVRMASPMVDRKVGMLMKDGTPIKEIQNTLQAPEFDVDLHYGVFVFEKLSVDEYQTWRTRNSVSKFPDDLTKPKPEYSGLYEDGWIAERAHLALSAGAGAAQRLRIAGVVPLIGDKDFETELTISVDGRTVGQIRLPPGTFAFERDFPLAPGQHRLALAFSRTQVLPLPDTRKVAARLSFAGFEQAPPNA